MNPHQHIFFPADIAFDNRHMTFIVKPVFISHQAEIPVLAGKICLRRFGNQCLRALAISDHILYGNQLHLMLFGKFDQVRHPRHMSIITHNFADDARR